MGLFGKDKTKAEETKAPETKVSGTRTLEEVNAELLKLTELRATIDQKLMPQIYFSLTISAEVLHVLQWFMKHPDIKTLEYSKEAIKIYQDAVKTKINNEQKQAGEGR